MLQSYGHWLNKLIWINPIVICILQPTAKISHYNKCVLFCYVVKTIFAMTHTQMTDVTIHFSINIWIKTAVLPTYYRKHMVNLKKSQSFIATRYKICANHWWSHYSESVFFCGKNNFCYDRYANDRCHYLFFNKHLNQSRFTNLFS